MTKLTVLVAMALMAGALVVAAPASGAPSRALYGTQKISAKACNQSPGCTGWQASCRGPNGKGQWKCKATNFFDDGSTCLIGLTWFVYRKKLYLEKAGKPRCYG
jgi:hypothetical protein